jgi:hypothetical protein
MAEVMKRKFRGRFPRLHIIMEGGHQNYGDAERIFFECKKKYDEADVPILSTITKAKKDQCGQLMMADFTAHTEYLAEGRIRSNDPTFKRPKSAKVPRGLTGITHLKSRPEILRNIRSELIERATPKKGRNAPIFPSASEEQPS